MFKDKLISLRKQNNMTQNDVAKLLHCSKGAVGKYERGEAEPSIDSLLKLSKFFHVSVDFLLDNHVSDESFSEINFKLQMMSKEDLLNYINSIFDCIKK